MKVLLALILFWATSASGHDATQYSRDELKWLRDQTINALFRDLGFNAE